jgi:hypothetical protein
MAPEHYSQHLIFFVTCEWAQKPRVFVPPKHFKHNVVLHFCLLGQFVSYKENELL